MRPVVVEAPGKVMLAGEYAVMAGIPCVAATTGLTMRVSVEPRDDGRMCLESNLWQEPQYYKSLAELGDSPFERAVAASLDTFMAVTVTVASQLKVSFGVGSSSALRLSVFVALTSYALGRELSEEELWGLADKAWKLQLQAQGRASGYDVATQLAGGWVQYSQPDTGESMSAASVAESAHRDDIVVLVGGKGQPSEEKVLPTFDVIQADPRLSQFVDCSERLVKAIYEGVNTALLVEIVEDHRAFLTNWGLVPESVSSTLDGHDGFAARWSYKTTGAGGEDAILMVGASSDLAEPVYKMSQMGWYPLPGQLKGKGLTVQFKGGLQ